MKSIYILILAFTSSIGFAQTQEWIQYLKAEQITSIAVFENKTWVGTTEKGLVCIDTKTNTTEFFNTSNSVLSNNNIVSLVVETNGTIWVGTQFELAKFDGQNWTTFSISNSGLPIDFINQLAIETNGTIWVGTWGGGLAKFDGQNWTTFNAKNSGLPYDYISSFAFESTGILWIGTWGGLSKFDGQNWFTYDTTNSVIPSNLIVEVAVESIGTLWVGTDDGKLVKYTDQNWTTFTTSNSGLPENNLTKIVPEPNGNLWIGTWSSGIVKFDGQNWTIFNRSNSGLPDTNISSITIDSHGNKWIGTPNGLAVYREGGVILETKEEISGSPKTFSLLQNYPNPFNPETQISFSLPTAGQVKATVYSIQGEKIREVTNQFYSEGVHSVPFNGSGLASGIYFYKIEYGNHSEAKRMILIK